MNTLQAGCVTTNKVAAGMGTVNVNGGTLVVNTCLALTRPSSLGSDPGALASFTGTLNLKGGTVWANTIIKGGGVATITMTNATLVVTVTNTIGTLSFPISTLSLADSTLQLPVSAAAPTAATTSLATGGLTNVLNIAAVPAITNYPAQFPLLKYTKLNGAFNFGLGALPPPPAPDYGAYLSNNTPNSSVDLVLAGVRPTIATQPAPFFRSKGSQKTGIPLASEFNSKSRPY